MVGIVMVVRFGIHLWNVPRLLDKINGISDLFLNLIIAFWKSSMIMMKKKVRMCFEMVVEYFL